MSASRPWSAVLVRLTTLCLLMWLSVGPAYGAEVVLQGIDVSGYPRVSAGVALTADLVPQQGEPAFTVLENDIEVTDLSVEVQSQERAPFDVVLLFDTSGSMSGEPIENAKAAARRFLERMRGEDRIALVVFSSEPRTLLDFTSDATAVTAAIDSLQASGETALHDGLIQSTKVLAGSERDRFVVVLSDGGDTTSINTLDAAAAALEGADATVYAIALESPEYDPRPLEVLATGTGGRFLTTTDATSLGTIYEEIAREIRDLYTLTFTGARPSTSELEIEIRVDNGGTLGTLTTAVRNPLFAEEPQIVSEPSAIPRRSPVMVVLIAAIVLVAVTGGVIALGLLLRPTPTAIRHLEYYGEYQAGGGDDATRDKTLRGSRSRVMRVIAEVVDSRGLTGWARSGLERAGLPLRAQEYMFLHLLSVVVLGLLVQWAGGNLAITGLTVIIVTVGPILALGVLISRRRARFEEQLPDVLNLISGSLRAGWGIQQAIELVVDEIAEPAQTEFRRVQSEVRFGLPLEQALGRMADRLESEDFHWTVTAIAIQRDVGGNLAEVLDIVATTIRQRGELRRHVGALTAESRFSAIVLAVLPFFVFGMLMIVSPDYITPMLHSPLGLAILSVGGVMLAAGLVWIQRLTTVEV